MHLPWCPWGLILYVTIFDARRWPMILLMPAIAQRMLCSSQSTSSSSALQPRGWSVQTPASFRSYTIQRCRPRSQMGGYDNEQWNGACVPAGCFHTSKHGRTAMRPEVLTVLRAAQLFPHRPRMCMCPAGPAAACVPACLAPAMQRRLRTIFSTERTVLATDQHLAPQTSHQFLIRSASVAPCKDASCSHPRMQPARPPSKPPAPASRQGCRVGASSRAA